MNRVRLALVLVLAGCTAPPPATEDVGQRIVRECKEAAATWMQSLPQQSKLTTAVSHWTRLCIERRTDAFTQELR